MEYFSSQKRIKILLILNILCPGKHFNHNDGLEASALWWRWLVLGKSEEVGAPSVSDKESSIVSLFYIPF